MCTEAVSAYRDFAPPPTKALPADRGYPSGYFSPDSPKVPYRSPLALDERTGSDERANGVAYQQRI